MEKTQTYREKELRELMAQEIESHYLTDADVKDTYDEMWNNGMAYAVKIIRGLR